MRLAGCVCRRWLMMVNAQAAAAEVHEQEYVRLSYAPSLSLSVRTT